MTDPTLPSPEELKSLTALDNTRSIQDIALFWFAVFGMMETAILVNHIVVYIFGFLFMGFLLNGLITLVHEASHVNFTRDKRKNDLIADLLVAGPAGMSVDQYRWHHWPHHRFLGDPKKEIELYAWTDIRRWRVLLETLKHMAGFYAAQVIARKKRFSSDDSSHPPPPPRSITAWVGFVFMNGALFTLSYLQGAWYAYFVLWVAPLFTLALLLSNFRTIVEHQIIQSEAPKLEKGPEFTRIIETGILDGTLVAPIGFYYHYEHHLYPSVPHYRLLAVRLLLQKKGHFETHKIERGRGYFNTLLKIAGFRPNMEVSNQVMLNGNKK